MSTWTIKNLGDGNTKEFDSRAEAENAKEELNVKGVELEIIPPGENEEKPPQEAEIVETEPAEIDETPGVDAAEPPAQNGDTGSALDKLGESIENDPLDVLPGYMITHVESEPTLNKRGVSVLAYHYGVSVEDSEILDKPSDTGYEHAAVRVRVSIDDGREFVGMGEAHADEMDKSRLLRMAETRAYKRAVIFATGTGIVGYQEVTDQL